MQKVTSYVYDLLGRVVGTESTGDSAWTCTSYDSAGRVSTIKYPSFAGTPARTVTYDYAVGGDPLTTSVGDDAAIPGLPAGSDMVQSVSNLLGETVKSTNVWGTTTVPTYNPLGQVVSSVTTPPATVSTAGATKTLAYTYRWMGSSHGNREWDEAGRSSNKTRPRQKLSQEIGIPRAQCSAQLLYAQI